MEMWRASNGKTRGKGGVKQKGNRDGAPAL